MARAPKNFIEKIEECLARGTWDEETIKLNIRAFQDAQQLSAWLSVYRYGNKDAKKRAEKVLKSMW